MKIDVIWGTAKEWKKVGILAAIVSIYFIVTFWWPVPEVMFGYDQSNKQEVNDFYKSVTYEKNRDEGELSEICKSYGGVVEDSAGSKDAWDVLGTKRRFMNTLVPDESFWESKTEKRQRLFDATPLLYATEDAECVLYGSRGRFLCRVGSSLEWRRGKIVMSCCWK